jgi:hypothetical protein
MAITGENVSDNPNDRGKPSAPTHDIVAAVNALSDL